MAKEILKFWEKEEGRSIPEGAALLMHDVTVMEGAVKASMEGYYGQSLELAAKEEGELEIAARITRDLNPLRATHQWVSQATGQEFNSDELGQQIARARLWQKQGKIQANLPGVTPGALTNALRANRGTMLEGIEETPSQWAQWTTRKSVEDFSYQNVYTVEGTGRLLPRAVSEDVRSTTLVDSGLSYKAQHYARDFWYPWEVSLADNDGTVLREAAREMGVHARDLEYEVNFEAMLTGLPRDAVSAGGVAVDEAGLDTARKALHNRALIDTDGESHKRRYTMDRVIHGIDQEQNIEKTLTRPYVNDQFETNTMTRGKIVPMLEAGFDHAIPALDWVGFQQGRPFMEQAFLSEYMGGPLTEVQMPDVTTYQRMGSYMNHTLRFKLMHATGALVTNANRAIRMEGA